MPPRNRVLVFLLAWIGASVFCVVFVDRGASTFAYEHHLRQDKVFPALTHLVDPLQAMSAIVLILAGIRRMASDWRPRPAARTAILAAVSLILAYGIKEVLKAACGRTWPETWVNQNPSWIGDHVYGFHPFHGGAGWASFPSGHTTQIATLAAVLWRRASLLRWVGVLLTLAVAVGLWGSDFHYVGDIVSGAFLGIGTACAVVAFAPEP